MPDQHDPWERDVYEMVKLAREIRKNAPRVIQPTERRWLLEVQDTITDALVKASKAA